MPLPVQEGMYRRKIEKLKYTDSTPPLKSKVGYKLCHSCVFLKNSQVFQNKIKAQRF